MSRYLVLFQALAFNRVDTLLEPTSMLSYTCVVPFDLEYIFFWQSLFFWDMALHRPGSPSGSPWLGACKHLGRGHRGEEFVGAGASGLTVQGPYSASNMALREAGGYW